MNKILIVVFLGLGSISALADQCQGIVKYGNEFGNSLDPEKTANEAKKIIDRAKDLKSFCAPCNDTSAKSILKTGFTRVEKSLAGTAPLTYPVYMVYLGNEALDLAYIYADGKNVALQVGCEAVGVPETLP